MRIALDAMGGDFAPLEVVRGALRAIEKGLVPATALILVGDSDALLDLVREESSGQQTLAVHHAPQVIEMSESAVEALRRKPQASILGCVDLVKRGEAGAVVTAGHTGAAVASAMIGLNLLEGVRRPGLAVAFTGKQGPTVLIDVGANIKCRPVHLFHYGVMASCYAKAILGVDRPRVALLNIGEEDAKGNELVRRTHDLFRSSNLDFIGNIEGQQVLTGEANVIVCEGFVGNVVLKATEGAAEFLLGSIGEELAAVDPAKAKEVVGRVSRRLDYSEHGGALLLGVEGIVVIGHGRSHAGAIASAIREAGRFIAAGVNRHILDGLRPFRGATV